MTSTWTHKQREQMLEFCRLAGDWYVDNQCTETRPWGDVAGSADLGRFLYIHEPTTGECRGNSVWGQGVAIMGLLPLASRLGYEGDPYRESAVAAAQYLMSLQILDARDVRTFGALRQGHPQTPMVNPRDAATAIMALCCLARELKQEEYLYRAQRAAEWYITQTMDATHWPAYSYYLDRKQGDWRKPEVWQAGAGLAFYFLYKLTGQDLWLEQGLRPLMEGYKRLCQGPTGATLAKSDELIGQDDYAAVAALGAYLIDGDRELLDIVRQRCAVLIKEQDADGSCPGFAGEFVAGLTWHNFCDVVQDRQLGDDLTPYREAINKAAAFAPSLQERQLRHRRAFGGLYGQSRFGVGRTIIHQRSTGYGLIFMLRTLGDNQMSAYNVLGW